MVFVIFCAIEVPLEISYGVPNTDNIIDILNWAIDLAFAVDICLCFRTAYVDEQGYLVGNVWGGEAALSSLVVWEMRLTTHTSPTLLHTSDRSVTATRSPATTSNSGSRSTSPPPSRMTCWPGPLASVEAAAASRPPSSPS